MLPYHVVMKAPNVELRHVVLGGLGTSGRADKRTRRGLCSNNPSDRDSTPYHSTVEWFRFQMATLQGNGTLWWASPNVLPSTVGGFPRATAAESG